MRQPQAHASAILGTAALVALLVIVLARAQGTKGIVRRARSHRRASEASLQSSLLHCYISTGPDAATAGELDTDACRRVIDELLGVNPSSMLILSGAAPLLRDDLTGR